MAHWSEKEIQKRVAAKRAVILAERSDLFKRFRAGGWEVNVIDPFDAPGNPQQMHLQRDLLASTEVHFRVKMPGAYPMRIKTVEQLRRLVKGVQS